MGGRRCALIVATYEYDDDRLTALRSPEHDAEALIEVLGDPAIGGFEVTPVVNQPAHEVNLAVADFFDDRRADDLLLVHFSCHGVKDEDGELYLAARNTRLGRLDPTSTSSTYLRREMDRTRAGSVVLLLDCCYAGAFSRGAGAKASAVVDLRDQLGGRGRAVIAASSAVQVSVEGDELTSAPGARRPSVFTGALVEGLRSGEADRDLDGRVSLDELYDYLLEAVRHRNPHQVPEKQMNVAGAVYVARRALPPTRPSELPESVRRLMAAESHWERKAAVEPLGLLLGGDHPGLALAARQALETLAEDPDERVRRPAVAALSGKPPPPRPPRPPPPPPPSRLRRVLIAGAAGLALLLAGYFLVDALVSSREERATDEEPSQGAATTVAPLSKSLLVASRDEASRRPSMFTVDVRDGRTLSFLDGRVGARVSLSADRRWVSYLVPEGAAWRPWVATVDGATARPLLSDADTLRCPFSGRAAWSPDGKRLALVCTEADGETSRALVTVSREGTVLTEALPSPLLHGAPSWLGDDRLVVSMADETDGPLRIVEVPAEGGDPRDLTQGTGGSDSAVDWSPSGLLFLRVPIGTREGGDVWMLDPAGQEVRLTTSGGIRMPTWGPERGRFAFLRGADGVRGDQRLWIKHVGEAETGLAVTGVIGYPAWGPR